MNLRKLLGLCEHRWVNDDENLLTYGTIELLQCEKCGKMKYEETKMKSESWFRFHLLPTELNSKSLYLEKTILDSLLEEKQITMQNKIKKIIEVAEKGGYKESAFLRDVFGEYAMDKASFNDFVLDKDFWLALAKEKNLSSDVIIQKTNYFLSVCVWFSFESAVDWLYELVVEE